jgi:hypothetical protein
MKRFVGLLLLTAFLAGCGGDSGGDKQPKLTGTPDPKIQGPATPGAGPGKGGGANQKAGVD